MVFESMLGLKAENAYARYGLFLEGGFDAEGRFVHIPTVDLKKMSRCFRQRVTTGIPQSLPAADHDLRFAQISIRSTGSACIAAFAGSLPIAPRSHSPHADQFGAIVAAITLIHGRDVAGARGSTPHGRGPSALDRKAFEDPLKLFEVLGHQDLDPLQFDLTVLVGEDIALSDDLAPGNLTVLVLELLRNAPCSFAQDLE